MSKAASYPTSPAATERPPEFGRQIRRLLREALGVFGLTLVVLVILGAVFADLLTQWDLTRINPRDRFQGPSGAPWLGTDQLGRDLFARVPRGGRIALFVAMISTAVSLATGIVLGLIAGYWPRWRWSPSWVRPWRQ